MNTTRREFYGRQYDEAVASGLRLSGTREEYIATGLRDDAGGVVDVDHMAVQGNGDGGNPQNMARLNPLLPDEFPEVVIR